MIVNVPLKRLTALSPMLSNLGTIAPASSILESALPALLKACDPIVERRGKAPVIVNVPMKLAKALSPMLSNLGPSASSILEFRCRVDAGKA